jgi:YlmC/YmxH family sporulation protein
MRFCELRDKEVINVCDGKLLGFIEDLDIDCCTGNILAIVVPAPGRFGHWFKSGDDFVIPWCRIQKIGDDVILVEWRHHHGQGKVAKV